MHSREGVYIEGKYLVLNIRFPYDIALSRIDTPIKAYKWIVHLLAKNWVNREVLFEMVDILERHFGYDLHNAKESI